jgi:hypothetical protein
MIGNGTVWMPSPSLYDHDDLSDDEAPQPVRKAAFGMRPKLHPPEPLPLSDVSHITNIHKYK